eukprot:CAMPEP_0173318362 /NCGR_PEP_ID=MMETSP1143-20121109/27616_1 /TAXON_ID=483371 /ORGANISM="non described non described, Strain CCMP2298" /LENGTH=241 /DNA_ID=CAMNT_0014261601 /DNA_START=65 /DNA_END=787 /DNA_ORIENTATION=+
MERRVKRGEVSITVGGKDSPSPKKLGGFPDAVNLAERYGVAERKELEQEISSPARSGMSQRAEMEMLRKLEDKNRRIEQLCVMLEALEPAPGVDPERIQRLLESGIDENVDFRDAKIVNLAKKSHRLSMQLNKERAVGEKLAQLLAVERKTVEALGKEALAKQVQAPKVYNRNLTATGAGAGVGGAGEGVDEVAQAQRELREAIRTVEDLKKRLLQATDESKQLGRALVRELGEGVSVEQA